MHADDKLVVNIPLLSPDREKLDAMRGCPAQKQPFSFGSLKDHASSAIEPKGVFKKDENGLCFFRELVSGGAGAGKSTVLVKKAL